MSQVLTRYDNVPCKTAEKDNLIYDNVPCKTAEKDNLIIMFALSNETNLAK